MEYKIVNAGASTGTITVMYLYQGDNLGIFPIDVPVVDGKYITGTALEELIQSKAPTWLLQRKIEVASASNFEDIASKVDAQALSDLLLASTPKGVPNVNVSEIMAQAAPPVLTPEQLDSIINMLNSTNNNT
jgi:hypothetical protein